MGVSPLIKIPGSRAAPPLLALLALSACMVGPNYHRPAAPTPSAYKETAGWTPAKPSDAADRLDWWTAFNDPILNDLENRVATSNQTVAASAAAYEQARALVAQQRAALFPTVSLNSGAGASGTIAGLANVLPEPLIGACAAASDGRLADAHRILAPALAFRDALITAGPPLAWVSVMKRLAEERHGIALGGVRAPLPPAAAAAEALRPALREVLAQLEVARP